MDTLHSLVCITESIQNSKPDPPDVLDRQKCLDALAALRHAKWFQVCITFVPFNFSASVSLVLSCVLLRKNIKGMINWYEGIYITGRCLFL